MIKYKFLFVVTLFSMTLLFLMSCKESLTDNIYETVTDKTAIEKIAAEDSSLLSFEQNYNEEGGLDFSFGKIQTEIFAIRVVRRVTDVNRTFTTEILGDSSFVTTKYIFTGNIFIAASYDSVSNADSKTIDTVIVKPFSSTITRKLIFAKVANTQNPRLNWKLVAISLPEGGTVTQNILIQKMTIQLPNDTLIITSPNEYFLSRESGRIKQIPTIRMNQRSTIIVEVFSNYSNEDFVTLTFGADIRGLHRVKRKFTLDSVSPSGTGYLKIYKQTFTTLPYVGHFHAVVSAMSRQTVYDDQAAVESKSWGVPYIVR